MVCLSGEPYVAAKLFVGNFDRSEKLFKSILDVLHLGRSVGPEEYAKAWVIALLGVGVDPIREGALDLSNYVETTKIFVEDTGVKVYRQHGGVYRIVGKRISFALVPHEKGVKYFFGKTPIDRKLDEAPTIRPRLLRATMTFLFGDFSEI